MLALVIERLEFVAGRRELGLKLGQIPSRLLLLVLLGQKVILIGLKLG